MNFEENTDDAREGAEPRTVDDVLAEMGSPRKEFPARTRTSARGNRSGSRGRRGPRPGFQPQRKRHAQASERASILAQKWVDLGGATGFEFPYDVNYFALALQRKVEKDPEMQKFLRQGKHEQVERWVAKMVERWWAEYVNGEITASNAKDFFLVTDWDDLREYARTCLRAAYLLKHGKRKKRDMAGLAASKDFRDRLSQLAKDSQVASYVERQLEIADEPAPVLDADGRDRLRSFVEKRRKS